MTAICIIPARGGSQRIPRKNIKLFHGKPIIEYSIECARESGLFNNIVVSTDDYDIAMVAMRRNAGVHKRNPDYSRDEVGTQDVMQKVLTELAVTDGYACCLYATAPMLQPQTLRDAMAIMKVEAPAYVVPVATWLRDPGQFYMGRAQSFIEGRPLLSRNTAILPIPPETECDINTPEDWALAEQLYIAFKGNT